MNMRIGPLINSPVIVAESTAFRVVQEEAMLFYEDDKSDDN